MYPSNPIRGNRHTVWRMHYQNPEKHGMKRMSVCLCVWKTDFPAKAAFQEK